MEHSQRRVRFANQCDQIIYVKLDAAKIQESYSKHESAMINANKCTNAQFSNIGKHQLNKDSSTNFDDQSNKINLSAGGGINSAMNAAVKVGYNLFGGGGSYSTSTSGDALINGGYTKSNVTNNTADTFDLESESKVNSNEHLTDQHQSNYLKHESQNKWTAVKVGLTPICPNDTVEVPVEVFNKYQCIYMSIYLRTAKIICRGSSVCSEEVLVEFDEIVNDYVVKPYFRDVKFKKAMDSVGLGKYVNIMQQHGWDDTKNWLNLDDDTLKNDLLFKKGHLLTFKRMIQEQFNVKLKQKNETDDAKNAYDV